MLSKINLEGLQSRQHLLFLLEKSLVGHRRRICTLSHDVARDKAMLLEVGHGRNIDEHGHINIPQSTLITLHSPLLPVEYFLDHAILAPRNVDVQETNEKILQKMPSHEIIYHSADSIEDEGEGVSNDVPEDLLRTIEPSSLPLSELKMKIGCPLMLLRNLVVLKGPVFGTAKERTFGPGPSNFLEEDRSRPRF
jgi:hypothetical protein